MSEDDATTERELLQRSRRGGRRGLGWLQLRGRIWWIGYTFRGQTHRESSHSDRRTDAVRLLRRRLAEVGAGRLIGPDAEKVTFQEIKELVFVDYRVNARRSFHRAEIGFIRLETFFGRYRALEITPDHVMKYIEHRLAQRMKPATVQYEIALLRRGLTLAFQAGKLPSRPHVPTLEVRNVRTGFFEEGELRELLRHLPGHDGRSFPFSMLPRLEAILRKQKELTTKREREIGRIIRPVFHRDGAEIKELRGTWTTACKAAGLPGRIVHDFRRTAVRNLERAGVPRSVAMKLTGHKTESVYRRYAIVAEADLREGVAKLAKLHEGPAGSIPSPTVVPLNGRRLPATVPRSRQ